MTRYLLGLILTGALALGVAACGDDDNGDDPDNGAITPAAMESRDGEGPPPVDAEPTVTDSGLQIIDIEGGDGAAAEEGAVVTVHYTGWLEDGTVFDSTEGGAPATFPLAGLIPGWQEGIPGMQAGGVRRLIIPPELAYGEEGRPSIPPNATLTFDIELVEVQ